MHRPVDPDPREIREWLERNDRPRRLAEWLFRRDHGENANASLSRAQSLALESVETLDLDLTDPAQRAFGDYELLERVGRGGMGVVYRARQLSLDRDVALKLLAAGPWAGADFIERLRNEARHAARLAHPHIVSVFDVGQHDAFYFYTMRLVEGESLRERLACDGALGESEATRIALSIAQALSYAHGIGVLHLDIKPANILLDADGEPHLADFGLAQRFDQDADPGARKISGTPQYMAPEQASGTDKPLTKSADIFALGATLLEMLAGRPPLYAGTPREVVHELLNGDIPRLRDVVPRANRELDAICARCLARDPGQRYASASELADDLRRWQLHRPVHAMRDHWYYRAGKFLRRNRLASALTALVMATVVTAMIAMAWQVRQTAREAERNLQIKDQLIQLFLQPEDHQYGTGQKTVGEFLDQGAERLQSLRLGSEVRGELAGVIVGIYGQLGQWQSAATLAERELGGAPITAETAAHADLRLVTGWATSNYGLSRVDGLSIPLASAIAHSNDTHSRVYSDALVTQTRVSIANGDFGAAVRTGELALSLLQDRAASKTDIANAHMELAAAYVGARQPRKGREHSERALVEIGDGDSMTHVHATTMAGLRRALFGEFASAQTVFDDGAAQWKRLSMSFPLNFESVSYAVNAFDLGNLDRSAATIKDGIAQSRLAFPNSGEGYEWHWLSGEIALHRGNYRAAVEEFAQGEASTLQFGARFASDAVYLLALQSVALTHANQLAESQRIVEDAQCDAVALPHADFATGMAIAAKAVLLSHEKHHREALITFDQALAELEAGRKQSAVLEDQLKENRDALRIRVWKAQAQLDAGDREGAIATATDAHQLGLATLDPNHPFMLELAAVQAQLSPHR